MNQKNIFKLIITILGGIFEVLFSFELIFYGFIPAGPLGFNFFTIGLLILGVISIVSPFLIKKEIIKNNILKNLFFWSSLIFCILGVIAILIFLMMIISLLPYLRR